jgi:hypothetical protein
MSARLTFLLFVACVALVHLSLALAGFEELPGITPLF